MDTPHAIEDDSDEHVQLSADRSEPTARSLGLLDTFTDNPDTDALAALARRPSAPPTLLEPSGTRHGDLDHRWALIVNTTVESDP